MKSHRKLALITLAIAIAIFIFTLYLNRKVKENKEVSLANKSGRQEYSYSLGTRQVIIKKKDRLVLIRMGGKLTAFPGKIFYSEGKIITRKIKAGLKGKYILTFFLFQSKTGKSAANLCLEQLRGNKSLKKFCVNSFNRVLKKQIILTLAENDEFVFTIRGKGIVAFSNPVFSPFQLKRNFVFLIGVDTLRSDRLRPYNNEINFTPNIYQFSRDAVVFKHAYSTAPWTLPAFMSLITGLYPNRHGVNYGNQTLSPNIPTIIETLQRKFLTYGFTGGGFLSHNFGFSRGFNIYTENNDNSAPEATKNLFERTIKDLTQEKHSSVFYFLHTYQIHSPYCPEKKFLKEFSLENLNQNCFNLYKFINSGKSICRRITENKRSLITTFYDANVATFDYRFGEFISFLKRKGIYRDSTIILFSDHGEELGEHGCWEHGHSLYNELIRIPLIVKFPGNKFRGKLVENPVSIIDILPTVMEIYGIKYKGHLDGKSVKKAFFEKGRYILSFLAPYSLKKVPGATAIITRKYKLIFNQKTEGSYLKEWTEKPAFKLFNIENDQAENKNLFQEKNTEARKLLKILVKYKLTRGRRGFLKGIEEQLKTLGYI